ncbi:DUF3558 domain-containing protein [Mycobacterium sp. CBMA271]|uniref:DUF3558 domain-containing protein n=1 Tax=unclassified Mycobacteroides TaxID=2618759 RepID=UPI0012DC5CD1|nr:MULTISPECIES: DUF3558 domain-containing protein [unclassified Mycobacteroides]MUM16527.1 hypothetical protein [Mycobacteroides sp. CBMA 326]MUM20526.1 DUF3558 domain-containing protein [Mycobacteroides sp. CBMA 271]
MFWPLIGRCVALATAALVAGCATTIDGQPATGEIRAISTGQPIATTTNTPVVTNTLPGPHPPPNSSNDGTTFDPCLAYSAEEIRAWGVNPTKVEDLGTKDPDLRGCIWSSGGADHWTVSQLVINRQVSEYLDQRAYRGSRPIELGGLAGAVYYPLPGGHDISCEVALPSQHAVVSVGVMTFGIDAQKLIPDPCAKAIEVATRVAPVLPQMDLGGDHGR